MLELHKLCTFQTIEGKRVGPASNSELKRWFQQKCIEVNFQIVAHDDPWPPIIKSMVLFPKNERKRCTLFWDSSITFIQIDITEDDFMKVKDDQRAIQQGSQRQAAKTAISLPVSDIAGEVAGAVIELTAQIKGFFGNMVNTTSSMVESCKEAADMAGETCSNIADSAGDIISTVGETTGDILEGTAEVAGGIIGAITD